MNNRNGLTENEEALRSRLQGRIAPYLKKNFATDFKRGILYFVDEELELVDVGVAMVSGGLKEIQGFIDDGLVFPPVSGEVSLWREQEGIRFESLEISPYRLIRKIHDHR